MEGKAKSVMKAMNFTLVWNKIAFPNKEHFAEIIAIHLTSTKQRFPRARWKKKVVIENCAQKIWAEIKWTWKNNLRNRIQD